MRAVLIGYAFILAGANEAGAEQNLLWTFRSLFRATSSWRLFLFVTIWPLLLPSLPIPILLSFLFFLLIFIPWARSAPVNRISLMSIYEINVKYNVGRLTRTWIDVCRFRASFHCSKRGWATIYQCYWHPPILINRIVLDLFWVLGLKQNTQIKCRKQFLVSIIFWFLFFWHLA